MRFRWVHLLLLLVVPLLIQFSAQAAPDNTPMPALARNPAVPNCVPRSAATAEAATTMEATEAATEAVTAEATAAATEAASALLRFESFEPTDFKFNPNPDKPVALVIVFSLIFQSESDSELPVQHPRFQLAIDGVPWGDLSSTDFQTGILRAHATQGIVLQSLLIVPRATDDQKAMLDCIRNSIPVDLTLTGTIEVYPGGVKQIVNVSFLTPQTIIRPHS